MHPGIENNTVNRVFVHPEKPGSRPHAASFCRMVDNLANNLGRNAHAEQGGSVREGKALTAGAAIQHHLVSFAVCAASSYVSKTLDSKIFAARVHATFV